MAFVLLPCDLPTTWPKIEKLLEPLQQEAVGSEEVTTALHALHSLCNISIDPGGLDSVPAGYFDAFKLFLEEEEEQRGVLQRALPRLVESALQLAQLKPPEGLSYSLQQQNDALVLSRPMVASLVAHTFLSTLPRRSVMSHPTLWNPIMAPVLNQLQSEDERMKVRAVLQYFALLAASPDNMAGRILLDRKVMGADSFLRLRKWRESSHRLCDLQVTGEAVSRLPSRPCLLACCCTAHPARAALVPHSLHDARGLQEHPELLVTGLLVEKLEDNEALQVTGVMSPSPPWAPRADDLTYALLDADDYGENWILQYESVNLLRELNKSFLAFSPPIKLDQEKNIPVIPAGVILKRPLYSAASVISHSLSAEISLPSTPAGKETVEKTFQYPEAVPTNAGAAIINGSKQSVSKETVENEKTAGQDSGRKEAEKSPAVADKETRGTPETDKKKMPKILELFLPKKLMAANKKKSEASDSRTDQTSGVGSMASGVGSMASGVGSMASVFGSMASGALSTASSSDKTSLLLKQEDGRESGFHEDSEDIPSYVTATATLKRKKNKKNAGGSTAEDSKDKENETAAHEPSDGSTSDLLNRVLKAIQKLEAEQSILLKDVPPNEIIEQDLIPRTDDLNTKSIARVKSKPPLPDSGKRPPNPKKRPKPKSSVEGCPPVSGSDQVSGVRTRRKLSVYQSCSEETQPPDDEQFFSASESLDSTEEAAQPRRQGGRRPRVSKCRRKSSFADRLKEALERGGSSDRGSQASSRSEQPAQSLSRNNSGGFVLSSDEIAAGEDASAGGQGPAGGHRKFTQRSDTVLELPGQTGSPSEGGRWPVRNAASAADGEEEEEEEEGSGSSRYSFSSDYTSDLDEVYDHLEEVLHQLEGATPGPRTAAIAQIAHSLLKRAFSESSKGLDVGLDAAAGDGSPASAAAGSRGGSGGGGLHGEVRPRSLSLYEGSCLLDLDHRADDTSAATGSGDSNNPDHKALRDYEVPQTEGVTVLTESWGCDELGGDRQLKALIQWAAASLAGAEGVVYNTHGHESLVKLGVLSRVLRDRQWTVGHLTEGIVRHCRSTLALWRTLKSRQPDQDPRAENLDSGESLFDRLLAPKEARPKKEDA